MKKPTTIVIRPDSNGKEYICIKPPLTSIGVLVVGGSKDFDVKTSRVATSIYVKGKK
jgi:hypothetical protein